MLDYIIIQTVQVSLVQLIFTVLGAVIAIISATIAIYSGLLSKDTFNKYVEKHDADHVKIGGEITKKVDVAIFDLEKDHVRAIIASMQIQADQQKEFNQKLLQLTTEVKKDIEWIKNNIK